MGNSHRTNMSTFKLQYFDARGLVEPCRILLALAGQDYEDARFPLVFGTPGDMSTLDRSQFEEAIESGRLDANLGRCPVLYVDGVGIGQSKTIMRFLASKLGFAGDDEMAVAKADCVMECLSDFKDGFGKAAPSVYAPDPRTPEELSAAMEAYWHGDKGLDKMLLRLDKFLGDGPFVLGGKPSVADVALFSFFRDNARFQGCEQYGAVLANSPRISQICDSFAEIESVKNWLESRPQTTM